MLSPISAHRATLQSLCHKQKAVKYFFLCLLFLLAPTQIFAAHGLSVWGSLKYPEDFKNFAYVNPNAPKGGALRLSAVGSFDSLNPHVLKGIAAEGIALTSDSLLVSAADEIGSAYGLIAEDILFAKDRSWVEFKIRQEAKWQDNSPITADDVVFSYHTLTEKGHPQYRILYQDVASVEKHDPLRVRFIFKNTKNRELPLLVGQMPIISKKYFSTNDFESSSLTPPLANGPYRVKKAEPGRSITYQRVKNYWAKDLAVNRGRYNFDEIRIDYYRDETVALEAFKAGEYDFRKENIAKNWAKSYDLADIKTGEIIKETIQDGIPTGMQCFVFNLRQPKFQNALVREALTYAYDFEWANKQLFFSAYSRNQSFFGNSVFESSGLPTTAETKLLKNFSDNLPARIFSEKFSLPQTDGSGNARTNLIKAAELLDKAGYILRDMKRIDPHTNKVFELEFLLTSPAFERVVMPYIRNLKKLGIEGKIRRVDMPQFIKRQENFSFDVIINWYTQGTFPGNEQFSYWHSSQATQRGSRNVAGIQNPAVDALVEKLLQANTLDELKTISHALDRVLLWNFYVIPQWNNRTHRVIYWNNIARPKKIPPFSLGLTDLWWANPQIKKTGAHEKTN
jgi:microcin C transport system substrate-binding protein